MVTAAAAAAVSLLESSHCRPAATTRRRSDASRPHPARAPPASWHGAHARCATALFGTPRSTCCRAQPANAARVCDTCACCACDAANSSTNGARPACKSSARTVVGTLAAAATGTARRPDVFQKDDAGPPATPATVPGRQRQSLPAPAVEAAGRRRCRPAVRPRARRHRCRRPHGLVAQEVALDLRPALRLRVVQRAAQFRQLQQVSSAPVVSSRASPR